MVSASHQLDPAMLEAICRRAGIRFHASLVKSLGSWIEDRMRILNLATAGEYFARLGDHALLNEERSGLSQVCSSRETFFLRDHGQIELLRERVLPELFEARGVTKMLRLWSMGCSTGEEVYTLAVLLEESGLLGSDWHIEITGFDIDPVALHVARQGVYRDWSFRGCAPEFRQRYFQQTAAGWRINERLRSRVTFEALDLLAPPVEMPLADLILCRNVFIYLDATAIDQALSFLVAHLAEGGYLFCAPGELANHPRPELAVCAYTEAVVYRKELTQSKLPAFDHSRLTPPVNKSPALPLHQRVRQAPLKQVALPSSSGSPAAEVVNDRVLLAEAWQAANRGQLEQAADLCSRVRVAKPLDPEAYYLGAILALAAGAVDDARDELRRVLYLSPDFLLAYPMLTELCIAEEDRSAAQRYARQGLSRAQILPAEQPVSAYAQSSVGEIRTHLEQLIIMLQPPENGE